MGMDLEEARYGESRNGGRYEWDGAMAEAARGTKPARNKNGEQEGSEGAAAACCMVRQQP
jgi:hypothetical protein